MSYFLNFPANHYLQWSVTANTICETYRIYNGIIQMAENEMYATTDRRSFISKSYKDSVSSNYITIFKHTTFFLKMSLSPIQNFERTPRYKLIGGLAVFDYKYVEVHFVKSC